MDNMSHRNNRPASRPNQQETVAVSATAPQPTGPVASTVARTKRTETPSSHRKRSLLIAAALVLILVAGLGAWYFFNKGSSIAAIDKNKYQAVVLSTDLLLFGRLTVQSNEFYRLSDVYYTVQTGTADQSTPKNSTTEPGNTTELRKLQTQIHGPENEMIIPKNQLLYFENLKPDGKASQLMKDDQKK